MREQSRPRHLLLHNNGHVNTIQRNWTCGTPRSSAVCTVQRQRKPTGISTNLSRNWIRGTSNFSSMASMVTETSTPSKVKLHSICIPPWAGGEPDWAVPPGVVGADHPPVGTTTPTPHVPPTNATVVLAVCQSNRGQDGHLHQLFHHLRLTKRGARRGVAHKEPGHSGGLPGFPARNRVVQDLQHFHHWVHHLRLGGVEERDNRHAVDESAPRCAAKPVPAFQTQRTAGQAATRRQAHLRRQGQVLSACRLRGGMLRNVAV